MEQRCIKDRIGCNEASLSIKTKMKRNLIITLTITALAAANVFAAEVALSPRAKEAVTKTAPGTNTDPNQTEYRGSAVAPRTLENQAKAAGQCDTASSLKCMRNMAGSPKVVGACADHPGAAMPCCAGEKK